MRDSTGALPLEEIATSSGDLSTIEGKTNEHSCWSSTTFTRAVTRVSRGKHPLVKFTIVGGGNHQKYIVHLLLIKGGCPPADLLTFNLFSELRRQDGGDHLYLRLRPQQEFNLTDGNFTAADNQHGSLFQLGNRGK